MPLISSATIFFSTPATTTASAGRRASLWGAWVATVLERHMQTRRRGSPAGSQHVQGRRAPATSLATHCSLLLLAATSGYALRAASLLQLAPAHRRLSMLGSISACRSTVPRRT